MNHGLGMLIRLLYDVPYFLLEHQRENTGNCVRLKPQFKPLQTYFELQIILAFPCYNVNIVMKSEYNPLPKSRMKEFWCAYESSIILTIGVLCVGLLAFEFGLIWQFDQAQKPLIIEKIPEGYQCTSGQETASKTQNLASGSDSVPASAKPFDCQFVGSKNSNKYHLPSCQWAKRIKPANLACFKSAEDAAARKYLPDTNCIK